MCNKPMEATDRREKDANGKCTISLPKDRLTASGQKPLSWLLETKQAQENQPGEGQRGWDSSLFSPHAK